jgi:hypothetical protein
MDRSKINLGRGKITGRYPRQPKRCELVMGRLYDRLVINRNLSWKVIRSTKIQLGTPNEEYRQHGAVSRTIRARASLGYDCGNSGMPVSFCSPRICLQKRAENCEMPPYFSF